MDLLKQLRQHGIIGKQCYLSLRGQAKMSPNDVAGFLRNIGIHPDHIDRFLDSISFIKKKEFNV